jgi:Na+/H+ antiporter NhaC
MSFARKLSAIVGNSDSYVALLWASSLGLIVAVLTTVLTGQLNLGRSMNAVVNGFKFMMHAILILILAWTLADITDTMHTADFIQLALGDGVAPWLIPALTFIMAAVVSFSTGSSWGTMAILYPLILPLSWNVAMDGGYEHAEAMMIFYNTVSCVLAGSVLGDHCSPISDTTILSSLATNCHHIDHVRTQMPYSLTVGGVALLTGTIPGALGFPFWISFPVGLIILYLIIRYFGKETPEPLLSE